METELVKLIPSLLWFFFILAIFIIFFRTIRDELLPNLIGFKAMGMELSFIKDTIEAAVALAEKSPQWQVEVLPADKEQVLKRAKRHLKIFRDSQILWVDNHPENNLNERRMFRQLMCEIDIAKSTEEAIEMIGNHGYDLIFSDMARDENATAGLDFLSQLRENDKTPPVIFYVGVLAPEKGVPAQAFGITNRPDELLHLTLDALERIK